MVSSDQSQVGNQVSAEEEESTMMDAAANFAASVEAHAAEADGQTTGARLPSFTPAPPHPRSQCVCRKRTAASDALTPLWLTCTPPAVRCSGPSAPTTAAAAAAPTSTTSATDLPVRLASTPISWFLNPLKKTIKKLVRPAVAHTRRKELEIKVAMPREAFEEFLSPLQPADAAGLTRDSITGLLEPTETTDTLRKWRFAIRKGSVSDRLFHLDTLDPPPPPTRPPPTTKAAELQEVDVGVNHMRCEYDGVLVGIGDGRRWERHCRWGGAGADELVAVIREALSARRARGVEVVRDRADETAKDERYGREGRNG